MCSWWKLALISTLSCRRTRGRILWWDFGHIKGCAQIEPELDLWNTIWFMDFGRLIDVLMIIMPISSELNTGLYQASDML
jgi:hypothetical protein